MFTGQNTIEQKQELRDDQPFDSNDSVQNLLCAWCLSEQGIPAGEGSHGICSKHANWLLLQQKLRRNRTRPRPVAAGIKTPVGTGLAPVRSLLA